MYYLNLKRAWFFVPLPMCHWSRMNNSGSWVKLGSGKKSFQSTDIQAILDRRAVRILHSVFVSLFLSLSLSLSLSFSPSSHQSPFLRSGMILLLFYPTLEDCVQKSACRRVRAKQRGGTRERSTFCLSIKCCCVL